MDRTHTCMLCGSDENSIIHRGVRGNSDIDVLKCNVCGLVYLNEFLDNSDEYYKSSCMRKGEMESTIQEIRTSASVDDKRRASFIAPMIENKRYLDFGCGAGGVLIRTRDIAREICGIELEQAMVDVLNGEGIKCYPSIDSAIDELKGKMDVISLFHVLEHIEEPVSVLQKLSTMLSEDGVMVIEVPNADDALLSLYENENFADFTYWESHLYLYNNITLTQLMKKAGLKIKFLGQIQRYPLSNTLYWLAKGRPGGHKGWSMLSNDKLDKEYGEQLARLGIADTIMAVVEGEKK